jgi:hypothetical protein
MFDYFDFMTFEIKDDTYMDDFLIKQKKISSELAEFEKQGLYQDDTGKTFNLYLRNNRYAVLNIPSSINDPIKTPTCIIFPWPWGIAWECALKTSKWRDVSYDNKFYVVFAAGTDCDSFKDQRNSFNSIKPDEDFKYLENVIEEMGKYDIDDTRIYYIGHSNGGDIFKPCCTEIRVEYFFSYMQLNGKIWKCNTRIEIFV